MPKSNKLTLKQDKFVQKYIELSNASAAYRQVYDAKNMKPEVINVKASELLKNGKVAVRLEELRKLRLERHMITIDTITDELDEARSLALRLEQAAPAISASMGKAKLHGLIVERNQLSGKDGGPITTQEIPLDITKLPKDQRVQLRELLASCVEESEEDN